MDLSKLTLADFLNEDMENAAPSATSGTYHEIVQLLEGAIGSKLRDLDECLALHLLTTGRGDVCIIDSNRVIAFYWGTLLMVSEETRYRGRELSIPLVLEASAKRGMPAPRKLTDAGRKALTAAWEVANGKRPNPWP